MALVIVSQPSNYDVAYRPLVYSVNSDVANLAAVKFVLTDETSASEVATLQTQSSYNTTSGFQVDFRSIIQQELANDINVISTSGTYFDSAYMTRQFSVEATEQILSNGSFSDGDVAGFSTTWIVNSALSVGEDDLVTADYFTTSSGTKVLTEKPTFETREGEGQYIALYNNEEAVKMTVVTTDINGVTATGVVNSMPVTNQTCYLGIGYTNINNYSLDTGSQPLIDNETASYTVQFETVTTGTVFDLLTVTVDREYRPNTTQFVFLNKFGALDFFTARSFKSYGVEIESTVNRKPIDDYTTVESYGRFKSKSEVSKSYGVGTHNLTNEEVLWLEELLASPSVWVVDGADFRPVIITSQGKQLENSLQSKGVYSLQWEFSYAVKDLKQLG